MKCPFCGESFHPQPAIIDIGDSPKGAWMLHKLICPACGEMIFDLYSAYARTPEGLSGPPRPIHALPNEKKSGEFAHRIWPHRSTRKTAIDGVPKEILDDYYEACAVLQVSPKASATLTRRCLQHILREKAQVNPGNLASEIQQVINSGTLPSHLAESVDAVRNIGNFAAHPIKSTSSGEILNVEPGEAELNLAVVEALFDFYFVQPDQLAKKREALNKKLLDAGKKPLK